MALSVRHGRVTLLALLALAGCQRAPTPAGEAVAGGDGGGLPRASLSAEGFDAAGLAAAVRLAQAQGARALLVMRHGHLVSESYWHMEATDRVEGGDLGDAALALAAGVALQELGVAPPSGALDPLRQVAAIEQASHLRYAAWLSRSVWQPLQAAPAVLAGTPGEAARGCCLAARAIDWLRLAGTLLGDGRFEGTQVAPRGWTAAMWRPLAGDSTRGFGLWLAPAASGAEPFAAADAAFLRGPGRTRLWLLPGAALAVLLVDAPAAAGATPATAAPYDETRVPNAILRSLIDLQRPAAQGLDTLVPGH